MTLATSLWLIFVLGCREQEPFPGVTETGNPDFTAGVTMRARSSDPSSISVRGDGDVDVDQLWMSVQSVQLFERTQCEDGTTPSFIDPFVSDATSTIPQVARGQTEATVYCGALVRLDKTADQGEGPDELRDHTMVMTGSTEERRPFLIRTSLDFEIPLSRDEGNFFLDESHDQLTVGLDVSIWLDEIWIDDGTPNQEGVIIIDDTSNRELLIDFEEGLLDAMDLDIADL